MAAVKTAGSSRLKLQEEMALCCKLDDKNRLIETLKENKFLKCIKMDHISSLKVKDAERRVQSEGAIINRIKTFPGSRFNGSVPFLRDVCEQMVNIHDLPLDHQTVYESIICRMSRPIAAADAYSKLKRIVKASNLSLVRMEDSSQSHLPCEVEIFENDGHLHSNTSIAVKFGLVRNADIMYGKADINLNGFLVSHRKNDPAEVWSTLIVIVSEKINHSTGNFLRFATITV